MNFVFMRAIPLAAAALLISAPASGQRPPAPAERQAADPLRLALEKQGYVAVPLIQEEAGCFVVECRFGGEKWRMLLDTGAESTSLDAGLAKTLGLIPEEELVAVGIEGKRKGFGVSVRGILIGDFDTRAMCDAMPLAAFDYSAMNESRDERKLPRISGIIGHSALKLGSAVIDYPTRSLYLRTPLDGLWPEIEGRWVAVGGEEEGREIDPTAPPRLEFKDRRLQLVDGSKVYNYGLHLKPEPNRYEVGLFEPRREFAQSMGYTAGGLLKVADGRLTVCLCLDPAKWKGMPDGFTAPAGSGRSVLEFRREK